MATVLKSPDPLYFKGEKRVYLEGTVPTGGSPTAPSNTAVPAITGTPQENNVVFASNGTWDGTSPFDYTYQWHSDGVDIAGATHAGYRPTAADVGTELTVTVTATNAAGSDSATSAGVGPVTADPGSGGGGGAPTEGQLWPRSGGGDVGPDGPAGGAGPPGGVGPPGLSASRYRARASIQGGSRTSGMPGSDIGFDTEDFDNDGIFAVGSPTELVAQHDGIYRVGCNVGCDATAGGIRRLTVQHHSGATTEDVAYDSRDQQGSGVGLEAETVIEMLAGDTVTFRLGQDSGSTITFNASAYLAGGTP